MNILISTNTLCFGGAESFSAQFYERIKTQFNNVNYGVFSSQLDILDRFPEIEKESIIKFENVSKTSSLKMLYKIFTVGKYLKEKKIDVIYCCQADSALIFWILKIFNKKIKIIYITMHVYENADLKEKLIWKSKLPSFSTDIFIGLSEYLSLQLKEKNKVHPSKVFINRLPVDTEKFQIKDKKNRKNFDIPLDKKVVGICCRLMSIKRVSLFIETFRFIEDDNIIGIIYGEGDENDMLLELIKKYDLTKKVFIRPFINNVNEVIPLFDLYLQTVIGPNLGLVTLEAFSCGVPVIMIADNEEEKFMITDTFCDQKVGSIATSEPSDIALKVLEILDLDDQQSVELSQRCRKLAEEKYSWPAFLDNNTKMLHKLK